jgi:hypothetical protein
MQKYFKNQGNQNLIQLRNVYIIKYNRMKILKTVLAILSISVSVIGQDSTKHEVQTLLGGKIKTIGIAFTSEGQYTSLNGGFKPSMGGSGMLVFNNKLGIGLGAYGIEDQNSTIGAIRTQAAYGGLQLEYTMNPSKVFHVSFPLLIGAGMASTDTVGTSNRGFGGGRGKGGRGGKGGFGNQEGDFEGNYGGFGGMKNQNTFGIIQPGVRFEVNLFKFARLYAGANYRIALNSTSSTLTNSKLSGLGIQAGIKVGLFDYRLKRNKNI